MNEKTRISSKDMDGVELTTVQATIIQLDNYGPWTVTPEPRPEMDLQVLQSRLFADVAEFIGGRGGYVFPTRYDNMIAFTKGLEEQELRTLQDAVGTRYPITISMGVAAASGPLDAVERASEQLNRIGGAQDESRREILSGETVPQEEQSDEAIHIAHFDVEEVTANFTNRIGEFKTYARIQRTYFELMEHMYQQYSALSFFVGGDNFISICPELDRADYERAINHVLGTANIDLRVGVGTGIVPRVAGQRAKHALEEARESESRVCLA